MELGSGTNRFEGQQEAASWRHCAGGMLVVRIRLCHREAKGQALLAANGRSNGRGPARRKDERLVHTTQAADSHMQVYAGCHYTSLL